MKLNLIQIAIQVLERYYTSWDGEAEWSRDMTLLALSAASSYEDPEQRHVAIAAHAFASLNEVEKEQLALDYEVPRVVYEAISKEVPAPESLVFDEVSMVDFAKAAISKINHQVGLIRQRFITKIPAQPTIYRMKEEEAQAFLKDETPDLENYPMIAAEIGVTADGAVDVARLYIERSAAYKRIIAALENMRLTAITHVEAAETEEAISVILRSFETNLKGLVSQIEQGTSDA